MNNLTIGLRNKTNKSIELSLEPEGTIYELVTGETLTVILSGNEARCVTFSFSEVADQAVIAIWPEHGDYEILED